MKIHTTAMVVGSNAAEGVTVVFQIGGGDSPAPNIVRMQAVRAAEAVSTKRHLGATCCLAAKAEG